MFAAEKALKLSGSYHSTGLRICIAHSLRAFTHCLQIGDVLECLTGRFWPSVLLLIPYYKINRPWFSIAESCELSAIGCEHKTQHNPWKVIPRVTGRILELVVILKECFRHVELATNSDGLGSIMWLPKKFIRFKMEVGVGRGLSDFLPDHRHQPVMMKDSRIEYLLPWVQHSFVKRDLDLDWHFDPVSTARFVFPTILTTWALAVLSTQVSINGSSVITCNILQTKVWVSNYLEEVLEARLWLLFPIIPIPFSQQKWRLVRIWIVIVDWNSGRDFWGWVYQVVGSNIPSRVMVRKTSCMILSEKPKSILRGLKDHSDLRQVCWRLLWGAGYVLLHLCMFCHGLRRWRKCCWRFRRYILIALWELAVLLATSSFCQCLALVFRVHGGVIGTLTNKKPLHKR
jgi:hypothetical protein